MSNLFITRVDPVVMPQPAPPAAPPMRTAVTAPTTPPVNPEIYALMFDREYSSLAPTRDLAGGDGFNRVDLFGRPLSPSTMIAAAPESVPTPAVQHPQVVQVIPLPMPRPAEPAATPNQNAALHRRAHTNKVAALPSEDKRTIFEKLFGISSTRSEQSLAYAPSDGGVSGDGQSATAGRYDRWTAVYDISAHTVYLPDGTKLEAHSGLGNKIDDPNYVHVRMRGATPPSTYDLRLRESLFHGVRAIRLIPSGGVNPFGRTGLLAHTFMLGPNGDSNGCVSFRNYNAFLRAFESGTIKRLVVVSRLG